MEYTSFLIFFFIFISSNLISARFTVIGPEQPAIAEVGKDVILDCRISITAELREVRWFRIQANYPFIINLYERGKVQPTCELPQYAGRMELMKENITRGNVALKLRNVSLEDEGTYRCYLETDNYFERAEFELRVTATGSDPSIGIEVLQDGGIKMMCLSTGWYPEPKLLNIKDDGQMATGDFSEIKVQQEDHYYSLEYSQVITQNSNKPFTCVVGTVLSNQQKESSLIVSETWFKKTSSLRRTELSIIVVACAFSVIIVVFVIHCGLLKKRHKYSEGGKAEEDVELLGKKDGVTAKEVVESIGNETAGIELNLLDEHGVAAKEVVESIGNKTEHSEEDLEELKRQLVDAKAELAKLKAAKGPARFSRVDICLDSAHPDLRLSDNGKTVANTFSKQQAADRDAKGATPFVLGKDGFTQGRHYWEVKVPTTGSRGWAIGIARESVKCTKEIKLRPQDGIWAVGMVLTEYQAFENPLIPLKPDPAPQRIRVYLDYEGQLSFYNAANMCHIFTFLPKFKEKVYPFFLSLDPQTCILP
ncbi:butyrophilin subfamily 2 member A2-like isoform X2 [Lissotriton helveticus]